MLTDNVVSEDGSARFGFGKNWYDFITKNFGEERLEISRKHLLDFLERDSLEGMTFLDIGCGSGLHSVAALRSGATSVHGFDYDPNSVAASKFVREKIGATDNWKIEQGSVLDDDFIASIAQHDLVYSWGVLHHTGDVWKAIDNASKTVKPSGLFYIALYSADVHVDPTPAFWLDVKQRYINGSDLNRRLMEAWYIWRFMLYGKPTIKNVSELRTRFKEYKKSRGMSMMTDIRDWLGGWPMEFVWDKDAIDFLKDRGFSLEKIVTGEANTEFLFKKNA